MNEEYHQHTGGKNFRKLRYQKTTMPEDMLNENEEEKEGPKDQLEVVSQQLDLDQEQLSESDSSLFECENQSQQVEGPLVKDQIAKLTENFKLGYKAIKDSQMLREAPLNSVTIDRIKVLVKNGRQ